MIGAIENAIAARLKDASEALGYRYKEVESLPVDVDERLIEHFKTYPAAGTVFGGWKVVGASRQATKVRASIHLVVANQSARNERATRMGVANSVLEVGTYQMIEDAVGLLLGQDLGLDITPLELGQCASLYTGAKSQGQQISLMWAEFFTEFAVTPAAAGGPLADFKTFHADWDRPPFGDTPIRQEDPINPLPPTTATHLDQA